MNSVLHPACEAAHAASNNTYMCMFAPHVSPFIQTPMFALQAKYDAWQIPNILGSTDPVRALFRVWHASMTLACEDSCFE
jgi:hypothetical protein